jgi:UDP-N-acetyl-D-mannosaminuronic acid dehydrogenase
MPDVQKVVVIGLGYIGLPTAALIANRGIKVVGVDTNPNIVKTVASGAIHITEPDLDGLVQKVVSNGSLIAASEPEPADVFMIAVPTPIDAMNKPDLTCVLAAVERMTDLLAPGNLVILESTCPVGTTEKIAQKILERRPDLQIGPANGAATISVAYCPERVLPGRILTEFVNNDRCIGGITASCARRMRNHHGPHGRIGQTDRECVSRHQHRLRQRALTDLLPPCDQCLGSHRSGEPPSAGEHSAAWARRRPSLHCRRSLVHHRRRA